MGWALDVSGEWHPRPPCLAFEFGAWLNPEFKLYLIKEFQRLKDDENDRLKLGWNLQRTLAKINYHNALKDPTGAMGVGFATDALKEIYRLTQG